MDKLESFHVSPFIFIGVPVFFAIVTIFVYACLFLDEYAVVALMQA
jgi:hypothetical protein